MLIFVSSRGRFPVETMFDCYGDPTEDPTEAASVIASMPDGRYLAAECYRGEILHEYVH